MIINHTYRSWGAIRFRTLSDINLVDLNLVKLEWSKNMQKNTELLDLGYWEERINNAR